MPLSFVVGGRKGFADVHFSCTFTLRTPQMLTHLNGSPISSILTNKGEAYASPLFVGAGGRGRTDTVSLPLDFESSTSANSITPAFLQHEYYITV